MFCFVSCHFSNPSPPLFCIATDDVRCVAVKMFGWQLHENIYVDKVMKGNQY